MPYCCEAISWIGKLVLLHSQGESLPANIAPRTDYIADDVDLVVCHSAQGLTKCQVETISEQIFGRTSEATVIPPLVQQDVPHHPLIVEASGQCSLA